MPGILDHLTARLAKFDGVHGVQPFTAAAKRAIEASRTVETKRREINANANLSVQGKQKEIRQFVSKQHAHEVVRAQGFVKSAAAALDARYKALVPAPSDKTDVAAAMIRSEARGRLAAIDRTLSNSNLIGTDSPPPTFSYTRNRLDETLRSFQHSDFLPRVTGAEWNDAAATLSDAQIDRFAS